MPRMLVTFEIEIPEVPNHSKTEWSRRDDLHLEMEDALSDGFSETTDIRKEWGVSYVSLTAKTEPIPEEQKALDAVGVYREILNGR
jgi:hypothetical protein